MARRACEDLSRSQRQRTPLALCRRLVSAVRRMSPDGRIAVLWLCDDSHYYGITYPGECWGPRRDARTYEGPWPVIAHPPCAPWGKYWAHTHQSPLDGLFAMDAVHRWGGVVEHPVGSCLFALCGRPGARTERIDQCDYGHLAVKPTLLYWWYR